MDERFTFEGKTAFYSSSVDLYKCSLTIVTLENEMRSVVFIPDTRIFEFLDLRAIEIVV